jgi:hypothetical protein
MPIIEIPEKSSPLTQGDILSDVSLFTTSKSWEEHGGETDKLHLSLCMIISRPCSVANKQKITVAEVAPFTGSLPANIECFEDITSAFADIRDGLSSPDVFYLGQLPGKQGSFGARLDSLHSIGFSKNSTDRVVLAENKRIARLNIDFARDLHLRLIRSFSSLGFDDIGWFTDADLQNAIFVGSRDRKMLESDELDIQRKIHSSQSQGKPVENILKSLKSELSKTQKKLASLVDMLSPYEAELSKRGLALGGNSAVTDA